MRNVPPFFALSVLRTFSHNIYVLSSFLTNEIVVEVRVRVAAHSSINEAGVPIFKVLYNIFLAWAILATTHQSVINRLRCEQISERKIFPHGRSPGVWRCAIVELSSYDSSDIRATADRKWDIFRPKVIHRQMKH